MRIIKYHPTTGISIADLEEVYFEGMLQGWISSNTSKILIPNVDGFKVIPFTDPDAELELLDAYRVSSTGDFFGTTTIRHRKITVWSMQYSGQYRPEDLPFLKRILRQQFEVRQFNGGRGPFLANANDRISLVYQNHADPNRFDEFKGCEQIIQNVDDEPIELGHLNYHGGLL